MVITCAYPDCCNRLKTKRLRLLARTHPGVLTFHRLPTFEPDRLKLWLLALRLDINTPMKLLKMWRVCSDHFPPDDFRNPAGDKVLLKSSAVPMVFSQRTEVCEQYLCIYPYRHINNLTQGLKFSARVTLPTKHATYQIALPMLTYLYYFKGKGRFMVTLWALKKPQTTRIRCW